MYVCLYIYIYVYIKCAVSTTTLQMSNAVLLPLLYKYRIFRNYYDLTNIECCIATTSVQISNFPQLLQPYKYRVSRNYNFCVTIASSVTTVTLATIMQLPLMYNHRKLCTHYIGINTECPAGTSATSTSRVLCCQAMFLPCRAAAGAVARRFTSLQIICAFVQYIHFVLPCGMCNGYLWCARSQHMHIYTPTCCCSFYDYHQSVTQEYKQYANIYLLTYLLTHLITYLLIYLLTHLITYLFTHLHTY